jgi:CheY-like chemotaxis protein
MSSALRLGTCNALIVDDEPSLRQSLARALAQSRFRCDFADNGRQALRMIAGSRYDLVVTNLRMPDVNGHALAVELLGQADRPVVIIVSEVIEPKIERDLRASGVDDILFKPIDYSMLAERAEELIELRAAQLDVCASVATQACSESFAAVGAADEMMPAADLFGASYERAGQILTESDAFAPAPSTRSSLAAAHDPAAGFDVLPAHEPQDMTLYHLVSQRIDLLEQNLLALTGEPKLPWFWLLLIFVNGLSLGWLLTAWTH